MNLIEQIEAWMPGVMDADLERFLRQLAITIPSPTDARDYPHDKQDPPADSVNYMSCVGRIEDQKNEPICVAQSNEVIARVHTNQKRGVTHEQGIKMADFDAMSFYTNILKKNDGMPLIAGTTPRNGMKCLKKYGIVEIQPNQGDVFTLDTYWRIRDAQEARNALLTTGPVSACFQCYRSLFGCTGLIERPHAIDATMGYHQMTLAGVDDTGFLVVNSWGFNWGNGGTAFLPHEYYDDWIMEAWCGK